MKRYGMKTECHPFLTVGKLQGAYMFAADST